MAGSTLDLKRRPMISWAKARLYARHLTSLACIVIMQRMMIIRACVSNLSIDSQVYLRIVSQPR